MSEQPKLIFEDANKKLVFENLQPSLKFEDLSKKLVFDITQAEEENNVFTFTFPFTFS